MVQFIRAFRSIWLKTQLIVSEIRKIILNNIIEGNHIDLGAIFIVLVVDIIWFVLFLKKCKRKTWLINVYNNNLKKKQNGKNLAYK